MLGGRESLFPSANLCVVFAIYLRNYSVELSPPRQQMSVAVIAHRCYMHHPGFLLWTHANSTAESACSQPHSPVYFERMLYSTDTEIDGCRGTCVPLSNDGH